MTYTRSHTRPSQKDLGCVVHPLNNKSLDNPIPTRFLAPIYCLKILAQYTPPSHPRSVWDWEVARLMEEGLR